MNEHNPPNGGSPAGSVEPNSPHSDELGALILHVPDGALIPEGATFYEGPDDTCCRIIKADGERCVGKRMKAYGLCAGHAGRGGVALDPRGNARLAHAERTRRKQSRLMLGISARRASQPLQAARVAAQTRANDYARAIVDAPLDDAELGTVARQQAAIRALELLYPTVTAHVEASLPDEASDVAGMGWQEMQALASSLVTSDDQPLLEPA